jgi:hypothetical protein
MSRSRPLPPRSVLLALRVAGAELLDAMAGVPLHPWNPGCGATAGAVPSG